MYIFVGINISETFRNRHSLTSLSPSCLPSTERRVVECTLSYTQNVYQNAGGEQTSMHLRISVTAESQLPDETDYHELISRYLLLYRRYVLNLRVAYVGLRVEITHSADLTTPALSTPANSAFHAPQTCRRQTRSHSHTAEPFT